MGGLYFGIEMSGETINNHYEKASFNYEEIQVTDLGYSYNYRVYYGGLENQVKKINITKEGVSN